VDLTVWQVIPRSEHTEIPGRENVAGGFARFGIGQPGDARPNREPTHADFVEFSNRKLIGCRQHIERATDLAHDYLNVATPLLGSLVSPRYSRHIDTVGAVLGV